jgi:hypothetical protein
MKIGGYLWSLIKGSILSINHFLNIYENSSHDRVHLARHRWLELASRRFWLQLGRFDLRHGFYGFDDHIHPRRSFGDLRSRDAHEALQNVRFQGHELNVIVAPVLFVRKPLFDESQGGFLVASALRYRA